MEGGVCIRKQEVAQFLPTIQFVGQLPMGYFPLFLTPALSNKYFHPAQFDGQIESNAIYIPGNKKKQDKVEGFKTSKDNILHNWSLS